MTDVGPDLRAAEEVNIKEARREARGERREIYGKISDIILRFCRADRVQYLVADRCELGRGLVERGDDDAVGFVLLGVLDRLQAEVANGPYATGISIFFLTIMAARPPGGWPKGFGGGAGAVSSSSPGSGIGRPYFLYA